MMDSREKSFDTAIGSSKLMITLCTAVIAFCVAVTNVKSADATIFTPEGVCQKLTLAASWIALVLSVAAGAWTQLGITHVLSHATYQQPADIWSVKIRIPFILQICLFLGGLLILSGYASWRMFG